MIFKPLLFVLLLLNLTAAQSDSLQWGVDLYGTYQTSAVDYYQNYNDKLSYRLAPYLNYYLNPHVSLTMRGRIENIGTDYVYSRRTYWEDDFAGHRGGIDIGMLRYQNDWVTLFLGRDFYIPGKRFYEGLLFSQYNYSYDQLGFALHNAWGSVSSVYLDLNDWATPAGQAQRYLFAHRYTLFLGDGYFAFNDVVVYGGIKRQFKPALFNPLMLFYPYQKNRRNFESNSLMSFELFFPYEAYYLFTELVIDDFQVDHKVPGDLEPGEWGINITIGKRNVLPGLEWKANYTRVANRTFNAPEKDYEKYIYKNYPIGHWLGNNFWEFKTTLSYDPQTNWKSDVSFYYNEYGDEALYGTFNKDFMNYTVEQGYSEAFPFGTLHTQSGVVVHAEYSLVRNLSIHTGAGYWFKNSRLEQNAAVSLGLFYKLKIN